MLARAILTAMHLVAAVGGDPDLVHLLRGYRDLDQRFLVHPVAAIATAPLVDALRLLEFAGALLLAPALQREAARSLERTSLDVREVGAADVLVLTPAGPVADLQLGRAIGSVLRPRLGAPRRARAVVGGADLAARAAARELGSLGVAHLTVLAGDRPEADRVADGVVAHTTVAAHAFGEAAANALLERADLIVRGVDAPEPSPHVLGPHLAVVDLQPAAVTPWRRQAIAVGALTVGARDVEAHRLHLALTSILGPGVALEPLLALLHGA